MIILAGEAPYQDKVKEFLSVSLVYAEEKLVTNLLARAMGNGNRDQLFDWLVNRPGLTVTDLAERFSRTTVAYSEWPARIMSVDQQTMGQWFLHDYRVFWCWQTFAKIVNGNVKIIVLGHETAEGDTYQAALNKFLEKRLPEKVAVLRLTEKTANLSTIEKFLK